MDVKDVRPVATEYLAECLLPGVTQGDLADLEERARSAAATSAGERVNYFGSMLLPEDEVVFVVFGGPSPDAVRRVATRAAIPFERIVTSVRTVNPEDRKEP